MLALRSLSARSSSIRVSETSCRLWTRVHRRRRGTCGTELFQSPIAQSMSRHRAHTEIASSSNADLLHFLHRPPGKAQPHRAPRCHSHSRKGQGRQGHPHLLGRHDRQDHWWLRRKRRRCVLVLAQSPRASGEGACEQDQRRELTWSTHCSPWATARPEPQTTWHRVLQYNTTDAMRDYLGNLPGGCGARPAGLPKLEEPSLVLQL